MSDDVTVVDLMTLNGPGDPPLSSVPADAAENVASLRTIGSGPRQAAAGSALAEEVTRATDMEADLAGSITAVAESDATKITVAGAQTKADAARDAAEAYADNHFVATSLLDSPLHPPTLDDGGLLRTVQLPANLSGAVTLGGVLAGTAEAAAFAQDMATQAELLSLQESLRVSKVGALSPEMFGADGTVANDTQAFIDLSNHVQSMAALARQFSISFEQRDYFVGTQYLTGVANGTVNGQVGSYLPNGVLHNTHGANYPCLLLFKNCKRVVLYGNGARIIMAPGMKVGAFDPVTGASFPTTTAINTAAGNRKYMAHMPDIIHTFNTDFVAHDLEVDGGQRTATLGGPIGAQTTEYSVNGTGVTIDGGNQILLENFYAHDCVTENLTFQGDDQTLSQPQKTITMLNVRLEYGGRNNIWLNNGIGFTWIGGASLHAGQGRIRSGPASCFDIGDTPPNAVRNATIIGVDFVNPSGYTVACGSGSNVRNVKFINCLFWATDYYLWAMSRPGFVLEDCQVYGAIAGDDYGSSSQPLDAGRRIRCHIEDRDYAPPVTFYDSNGTPTMKLEAGIRANPLLAGKVEAEIVNGTSANRWKLNVYLDGTLVYSLDNNNTVVGVVAGLNAAQTYVYATDANTDSPNPTGQPARVGRTLIPIVSSKRGNPISLMDTSSPNPYTTITTITKYGRLREQLGVSVDTGTNSGTVKMNVWYDANRSGSFSIVESFDNMPTCRDIALINSDYVRFFDAGSPAINPLPAVIGRVSFPATAGLVQIIRENELYEDCDFVANKCKPLVLSTTTIPGHGTIRGGTITMRYTPQGTHQAYANLRSVTLDGVRWIEDFAPTPFTPSPGFLSLATETLPALDRADQQPALVTVGDVAIDAFSNVARSANFTSGHVGQTITIPGAGDDTTTNLTTTIVSVDTSDPTLVLATLVLQAGTSVSGVTAIIGSFSPKTTLRFAPAAGYRARSLMRQIVAGSVSGFAVKIWHRGILVETLDNLATPAAAVAATSSYVVITDGGSVTPAPYNLPALETQPIRLPETDIGPRGMEVPGGRVTYATWDPASALYKSGWIAATDQAVQRHILLEPGAGSSSYGSSADTGPIEIDFGLAPPTTGYHRKSAFRFNEGATLPTDTIGWRCQASGVPGVWGAVTGAAGTPGLDGAPGATGRPGLGFVVKHRSGMDYSSYGSTTSVAMTADQLVCIPIFVAYDTLYDQLALELSNLTGVSGSPVVRLGIYTDSADAAVPGAAMYPGDLIIDAGTFAADAAVGTGRKPIAISRTLLAGTAGRVYWLGACCQNTGTTKPSCRTLSTFISPLIALGASTTVAANGYAQNGVTGALPSTFSSTVSVASNAPIVRIHAA